MNLRSLIDCVMNPLKKSKGAFVDSEPGDLKKVLEYQLDKSDSIKLVAYAGKTTACQAISMALLESIYKDALELRQEGYEVEFLAMFRQPQFCARLYAYKTPVILKPGAGTAKPVEVPAIESPVNQPEGKEAKKKRKRKTKKTEISE